MEGFRTVTGGGDEGKKGKAAFAGRIVAVPGAMTLRRICWLILETTLWIPKQETEEKSQTGELRDARRGEEMEKWREIDRITTSRGASSLHGTVSGRVLLLDLEEIVLRHGIAFLFDRRGLKPEEEPRSREIRHERVSNCKCLDLHECYTRRWTVCGA